MLQQKLVKAAAIHVVGVILRQPELGNFAEADDMFLLVRPMRPNRPMFVHEVLALHHRQKTDLIKNARCRADQRFSDMRPRVYSLIDYEMANPRPRKIRAQRRTGRAAADNNHLGIQGRACICGCAPNRLRCLTGLWGRPRAGRRAAGGSSASRVRALCSEHRWTSCVAGEMEMFENVAAQPKEFRTIALAWPRQRNLDDSFNPAGTRAQE